VHRATARKTQQKKKIEIPSKTIHDSAIRFYEKTLPIPTMLSFFILWAKVKALADEKLQAGPYFLILTSLSFIHLRGFDFVQRIKKLNIVGLLYTCSVIKYQSEKELKKIDIRECLHVNRIY
jgi:hypothetical protein